MTGMDANPQTRSHVLACPVCQQPLVQQERRFVCEANHSFDLAKQGYLNLLLANHKRSRSPGDNAEMIQARQRFLDQGHYAAISAQLNQLVAQHVELQSQSVQVADLGCGDGYYSARLLQALSLQANALDFYGIDISKDALRVAARRQKQTATPSGPQNASAFWLVASGKRLPVIEHSLDAIVSLFTPVMPEGAHQALKTGGKLIIATTGRNHLLELRQKIYPDVNDKVFDPTDKLTAKGFQAVSDGPIKLTTSVSILSEDLPDLLIMTPHGWRSTPEARARLLELPELEVTLDVDFRIYEALDAAMDTDAALESDS